MITQVCINNFQGLSGTYDLNQLNIVTGDNGTGKSTITKAIQQLLLKTVPTDEVNNTADEQFRAYCSHDAGEMSIEIICDNGSLKRVWTKTKNKVSTKSTWNGQPINASTNFLEATGVSIFNVSEFWRSTPSQQVNVLCDLAGVDPDELERLDEEIDRTNEEKNKKSELHKNAISSVKDHDKEIQDLVESGRVNENINTENVKDEINEIEKKVQEISNNIYTATRNEAKRKSQQDRTTDILSNIESISSELDSIQIPSSEFYLEDLEDDLKKQEKLKLSKTNRDSLVSKINRFQTIREPVPPARTHKDIDELNEKIARAETGGGISEKEKVEYQMSKSIFEHIQNLEPLVNQVERDNCLNAIKEFSKPCRDAMKRMENQTSLEIVEDWKRQVKSIQSLINTYDKDYAEYISSRKNLKELEDELSEIDEVDFNEAIYHGLVNEIASRKQENKVIENSKRRKEELEIKRERLTKELDGMSNEVFEEINIKDLETKKKEYQDKLISLKESITQIIEFNKLSEIRDRKHDEIESYNKEVESLRHKESCLQQEKTALLNKVTDTLAERAEKVTKPSRVSIKLPTSQKKSEAVRFFIHQPNGDITERSTLCGAEKVEFDLALSYALVGDAGVISCEVAELTEFRMNELANKATELNDSRLIQLILVGHSLDRFESDPRFRYLSMDKPMRNDLKKAAV